MDRTGAYRDRLGRHSLIRRDDSLGFGGEPVTLTGHGDDEPRCFRVRLDFAAQTFMLPALIPPSKIEEEARAFQINESKNRNERGVL